MKVNGDEFLKNIEKEQARSNPTPAPHSQEEMNSYYNNFNENLSNQTNSELDDIRLQENKNNKQKYILFGLSLVLLFLITIVTLRLLSEDTTKNNFTDNNLIEEKNYDFVQKQNPPLEKKEKPALNIDEIVQAEENIKSQTIQKENIKQEKQSDLFELESKEQIEEIKVEKKVIKETIVQKPIKQEPIKEIVKKAPPKPVQSVQKAKPIQETVTNVSGYYIQVGAFTKSPDTKLLTKIKNNNFTYIVHRMDVKGKMYNKVLIGKYNSKNDAKKDLTKIKSLFNKYAYILKVK